MNATQDAIRYALQQAIAATNSAKAQLPSVVAQAMRYAMVRDIIIIALIATWFVCMGLLIWRYKHNECDQLSDDIDDFGFVMFCIGCVIVSAIAVISLFVFGSDLLELLLAPKVWLLEGYV